MRLYATVSSERASKGQGGNEFLSIDLRDERGRYGWIRITPDSFKRPTGKLKLVMGISGHETLSLDIEPDSFRDEIDIKGNKQKGECKHNNGNPRVMCPEQH